MTADTDTTTVDGVEGYPSLTALRDAHGTLLEQRRARGDTPDLLAAAERLIQRGVATGALLDGSEDRRAAQNLLNYWANLLYRAGREPLDATLAEFDPLLAPALPDELCPYLGLDAFSEASAERFFGRQELITRAIDRLREERLVAVVGPSGSGKSSVVRAGLLPALQGGALPGSETWRYLPPIVPGSDPLASLERVLGIDDRRPTTDDQDLSAENKEQRTKNKEPGDETGSTDRDSPLVLVVDQFEEVFTLCEDAANRQAFIEQLLELAGAAEQHRVILTMRSDFETFVQRVPELQLVFERGRVQVIPLSAAELREAIEAPAAQVGLKFEQGVVDLLLQDILGEPAGLPLLQFTLLKLWEQRERNRVTRAAYERVGGGRLALARSADAFYQSLIPEEQVTARRILLRMVRPGEGLEVTSSRVRRTTLLLGGEDPGRVERVLGRLVDARLVRLTAGETPEHDQVEVAHEALVRNWPTLVDWLEQEKAAIATRRRLEGRAAEWARLGRGDAGLLDEVEWHEAERWLQSAEAQYLGYGAALPAYIAASRAATERAASEHEAAHQRELEQARALAEARAREVRRTRRFAIGLAVAALLALSAAGFAVNQQQLADGQRFAALAAGQRADSERATAVAERDRAETQRQLAVAFKLAAVAVSRLNDDSELSLLLATESISQTDTPEGEDALRQALTSPPVLMTLHGHTGTVDSVAFSPDGRLIVTVGAGGTVRIWDAATGQELKQLRGHTAEVYHVAFSSDGRKILTASADGTARIWDAATGQELRRLKGHMDAAINTAAFSPDGRLVATGSADGTARIWDAATGQELRSFVGGSGNVTSVVFSPDGTRIATAGDDGIVRVSNPATGELIRHDLPGTRVAFSPDGSQLVTGNKVPGGPYAAATWDIAGGEAGTEYVGHTLDLSGVAFSPDPGGRYFLTASRDQTARIWDTATGRTLAELRGHKGVITDATFSPDGGRVATASGDGTVRIWDIASWQKSVLVGYRATYSPDGAQIASIGWNDQLIHLWDARTGRAIGIAQGHQSPGISLPFYRSDGRQFVTGSDDGTARVWDATSGKELYRLTRSDPVDDARVHDAAFSPDGQRIITAGQDGIARIWDATTHQQVLELKGHSGWLATARFSPDGRLVVTASVDHTARIWDAASGTPLHVLVGHNDAVTSAAFSPDGQQIVTSSVDGTARLWDVATGKELRQFVGHSGEVTFAAFSPDGRTIATASRDHTARVWDVATAKELFRLPVPTNDILDVAYSPDGTHVITGGWDGVVRIHSVRFEDVLAQARASIHRTLSCTERAQFLQDTRCPNS